MNSADNELIDIFIIESSESLADLDQQLLAIEAAGEAADPELVNQLFRAVHSVKGVAGFLGFEKIIQVAHHLESALSLVRNRQLIINEDSIETLLGAGDLLRRLVKDARQSGDYDAQEMVDALQRLNQACKSTSAEQQLETVEHGVATLQAEFTPATTTSVAVQPTTSNATNSNTSNAPPAAPPEASIRVPVPVLERLMNLAGELVLTRNQMLQVISTERRRNLTGLGTRLDQVTSELHDAIMSARMQQVGTVLNRFPRLVRDLNRKLGKQCVLQIEGAEVELDRTILEAIGDPLTHLVRNSVDHGLEKPDQRVAAGKSPEGTLLLRAFHEAGKVHITLADDGREINVDRVREKAISRGLISADQAANMSQRELVQLVFQPGFSTAEQVTDVSGRGVGMDVVKTSIQRVGGTVEIESTPNQGTTVHISLPLTLAIIPSWTVAQSGFRFAIPESAIIELVRPQVGDANLRVEKYGGSLALRWRDSLLPLLRMTDVLPASREQDTKSKEAPQNIVIVETGRRRFGLAVDTVEGPEQIVVKALGRHLRKFKILAGAAVLGDGCIAYVLDIAGLGAEARLKNGKELSSRRPDAETTTEDELQTVLLIRNAAGKLLAVPRPMITRIERIDATQVKQTGRIRTLTYRAGTLPIVEVIDEGDPQQPLPKNAYVLVFSSAGREAGLLAHELVDVCEASTDVDTSLFFGNGLMGALMIEGELTRLVDVYDLLSCSLGNAKNRANGEQDEKPRGIVLLAEDSAFIRQQVARVVKDAGYHVICAENGQKAWDLLQAQPELIDLVLTDIEMPVMNGCELSAKIRTEARFVSLPIIALTSLTSDEQMLKGTEAGIDQWLVKMDRERLLAAIAQLLSRQNTSK